MENEQKEFYKIFEDWVSSQENKNTQNSYSRIIPQFFYLMFEKNMKEISLIELKKITPERVREKYIEYLRDVGMKDTTIINYLNTLSSFIIYLSKNNKYSLDYWNITRKSFSKETLDNNVEKINIMTNTDFNQLKEWFLDKKYAKRYGNLNERYSLVVELIWITSMRLDEAFSSFRWSDIYLEQDDCGNIGWTIYLNNKASRAIKKPISDEFYNKLNHIFYDVDNLDNQLVLSGVSKQTFSRQLKEYSYQHNVNYTSESIRLGLESEVENDRTKTISLIESTDINNKQFDLLGKEDFVAILNKRVDLKKAVMIEFNK